jgi:hypothetical protein
MMIALAAMLTLAPSLTNGLAPTQMEPDLSGPISGYHFFSGVDVTLGGSGDVYLEDDTIVEVEDGTITVARPVHGRGANGAAGAPNGGAGARGWNLTLVTIASADTPQDRSIYIGAIILDGGVGGIGASGEGGHLICDPYDYEGPEYAGYGGSGGDGGTLIVQSAQDIQVHGAISAIGGHGGLGGWVGDFAASGGPPYVAPWPISSLVGGEGGRGGDGGAVLLVAAEEVRMTSSTNISVSAGHGNTGGKGGGNVTGPQPGGQGGAGGVGGSIEVQANYLLTGLVAMSGQGGAGGSGGNGGSASLPSCSAGCVTSVIGGGSGAPGGIGGGGGHGGTVLLKISGDIDFFGVIILGGDPGGPGGHSGASTLDVIIPCDCDGYAPPVAGAAGGAGGAGGDIRFIASGDVTLVGALLVIGGNGGAGGSGAAGKYCDNIPIAPAGGDGGDGGVGGAISLTGAAVIGAAGSNQGSVKLCGGLGGPGGYYSGYAGNNGGAGTPAFSPTPSPAIIQESCP